MGKKSAEERIGEFLRFGSRLGLERMTELMKRLGDPQDSLKVIHVAGTNGKGSVSRYIYETLIEAGYHTGLYTSPFLETFNERIEADRELISDGDLERCTDLVLGKVEEMTSEGLESPTEFEVVTAVAFLYFSMIQLDAVVLEVGLGGRGDSTNIVSKPVCSVITSISYDHMDRLGNTISGIASEKAGIIKAGCPVVVSTEREDAIKVFTDRAYELSAPLYDARKMSSYEIKRLTPEGAVFDYRTDTSALKSSGLLPGLISDIVISMGGEHQVINAAEALTALHVQDEYDVPEDAVRRGFRRARQPGRFEVMYPPQTESEAAMPGVHKGPWVILDGAHNQDGARRLKEAVSRFFPGKSILLICGILRDKDEDGILDELIETGTDFIATEPESDRKLSAYELAKGIHEREKLVYEIPRPKDAAALAMSLAGSYDVVLFTGSLYLIGEIRRLLRERYLAPGNICFDRTGSEDEDTAWIEDDED